VWVFGNANRTNGLLSKKEYKEFKELQESTEEDRERADDWRGAALVYTALTKRICSMIGPAETGQKNRRLPGMTQRLVLLLVDRIETLRQNIALGNSRKPPVFTFLGRNT
jgi:hypothetical protein